MSTTTYLCCKTHKLKLWVGQSSYIYSGDERVMDALAEFLHEHRRDTYDPTNSCHLFFTDEHDDQIMWEEGYTEFKPTWHKEDY
jgi:hypothetical protein